MVPPERRRASRLPRPSASRLPRPSTRWLPWRKLEVNEVMYRAPDVPVPVEITPLISQGPGRVPGKHSTINIVNSVPKAPSGCGIGTHSFSRWAGLEKQPHWDRTVQITWHRKPNVRRKYKEAHKLALDTAFNTIRKQLARFENINDPGSRSEDTCDVRHARGYFLLPNHLRFQIMRILLLAHNSGKAVRMSPAKLFEPVWPVHRPGAEKQMWTGDYFDSLSHV